MATGADIVKTAREALGTPWRHQGRLVPQGVDCIGLILWTARKLNITHYEPPAYQREAQWSVFLTYFRDNLHEISMKNLAPGDILTFRQQIFPCHCAFVTQAGADPKMIHAYLPRRKVVEERYTPDWQKQTVAAFRFPGVE